MSKYELRTLEAKDIFPMINLIKAFGIDNFKKCFSSINAKEVADENGNVNMDQLTALVGLNIVFDILSVVIGNLGKCEKDMYKFLESVSNLKVDEIKKLPMDEFAQMIIDVLQKEEFVGFFKVVLKLLK